MRNFIKVSTVWRAAIAFLALCVSLLALAIGASWNARQHRLHESERALSNLAQTLSSQVDVTLKQADTSLLWLVTELEAGRDDFSMKLPGIRQIMDVQLHQLGHLEGLMVIDSHGASIASTVAELPSKLNLFGREYFQYHLLHDDRRPYIGRSVKSRITGKWVMTISRRFNQPDGRFGGVVVAAIPLVHFSALYQAVNLGKSGVVTLISDDARLLVRRPFAERDIGKDLSGTPLFRDLLPRAPYGTATTISVVDGVERIIGYRRVPGFPLITVVAVGRQESLSGWRTETFFGIGLMLLLLSLLGVLSFRLIRLMQRQDYVQQALLLSQRQLLESAAKFHAESLEDGLTGLANRRMFDQYLRDEIARAGRERGELALLLIDIDHFKALNDQYGHLVGDECLQIVAMKIGQAAKRPSDMAFRYGGEEFAVVLPGADSQGALLIAESIRAAVESAELRREDGGGVKVTVSIGISSVQCDAKESPEPFILAADKALYIAKSSGRNRTVVFSDFEKAVSA